MHYCNPDRFNRHEEPFVICDLGTADGLNSILLYQAVIDEVRNINHKMPIMIYLNDIPQSDLNKAAANLQMHLQ